MIARHRRPKRFQTVVAITTVLSASAAGLLTVTAGPTSGPSAGPGQADPPFRIPDGSFQQGVPAVSSVDRIAPPDPVPALKDEQLGDVIDRLADGCKVEIQVDWDGLRKAGIDRSTRLRYGPRAGWQRPSFGAVLRFALEDAEWAVPGPPELVDPDQSLDFTVVKGVVRIDLHGPLLQSTAVDQTYDVASVVGNGPDRDQRADGLRRYVQSRIRWADWSEAPADAPRLAVSPSGTSMLVRQPPDVQAQVEAILLDLRREPPPANLSPDPEAQVKRRLARPMPEVRFNRNRLSDVIDFLRDVTDTNIYVDWPELARLGVGRQATVSARLRSVTFGKALDLVLRGVQTGDDYDHRLAYVIDGGAITVSSRRELDKDVETRRYDVAGLVDGKADSQVQVEELVRYLTANVEPASWHQNGGSGQIQASPLRRVLLVTQTPDNQGRIADLLVTLRARQVPTSNPTIRP